MTHMDVRMTEALAGAKKKFCNSSATVGNGNNTCCVGLIPFFMTVSIYIRPAPCQTQELAP
ncbi:hypothetical protein POKO110462_03590 [Pontibacter korlensis]